MRIVQRLIARRIVGTALLIFSVLVSLAAATQVLNHLLRVIDAQGGLWTMLRLTVLILPNVTAVMLPIAWLVALIYTFNTLRENSETAALMAAGVRLGALLRPAALLSLGAAGLMLVSSLYVEPLANRTFRDLLVAMRYEALSVVASSSELRRVERNLYVRAGPRDEDGEIQGFFLLDRRERGFETLYLAETIALTRDERGQPLLEMLNGRLYVRDLEAGLSHSAAFGRYVSPPDFFFSDLSVRLRARERSTAAIWTDISDGRAGSSVWREAVRRFTDWLYPLPFFAVVAWLVVRTDLAGRAVRRQTAWTMVVGIGVGAAIRVLGLTLPGAVGYGFGAIYMALAIPLVATVAMFCLVAWEMTRNRGPGAKAVPT